MWNRGRRLNFSDRELEFVEGSRQLEHRRGFDAQFVVAAADVLDGGVPSEHDAKFDLWNSWTQQVKDSPDHFSRRWAESGRAPLASYPLTTLQGGQRTFCARIIVCFKSEPRLVSNGEKRQRIVGPVNHGAI